MNPPQVYMCSPSWTLLPPPSPYHPSGSSQCTSPKHPVSCIEPGLATRFLHDILYVSSYWIWCTIIYFLFWIYAHKRNRYKFSLLYSYYPVVPYRLYWHSKMSQGASLLFLITEAISVRFILLVTWSFSKTAEVISCNCLSLSFGGGNFCSLIWFL